MLGATVLQTKPVCHHYKLLFHVIIWLWQPLRSLTVVFSIDQRYTSMLRFDSSLVAVLRAVYRCPIQCIVPSKSFEREQNIMTIYSTLRPPHIHHLTKNVYIEVSWAARVLYPIQRCHFYTSVYLAWRDTMWFGVFSSRGTTAEWALI